MIETDTVVAMNRAGPRLTLAEGREADLPIELNQLKRAIEDVARTPTFHTEPADFRATLLASVREDRP